MQYYNEFTNNPHSNFSITPDFNLVNERVLRHLSENSLTNAYRELFNAYADNGEWSEIQDRRANFENVFEVLKLIPTQPDFNQMQLTQKGEILFALGLGYASSIYIENKSQLSQQEACKCFGQSYLIYRNNLNEFGKASVRSLVNIIDVKIKFFQISKTHQNQKIRNDSLHGQIAPGIALLDNLVEELLPLNRPMFLLQIYKPAAEAYAKIYDIVTAESDFRNYVRNFQDNIAVIRECENLARNLGEKDIYRYVPEISQWFAEGLYFQHLVSKESQRKGISDEYDDLIFSFRRDSRSSILSYSSERTMRFMLAIKDALIEDDINTKSQKLRSAAYSLDYDQFPIERCSLLNMAIATEKLSNDMQL